MSEQFFPLVCGYLPIDPRALAPVPTFALGPLPVVEGISSERKIRLREAMARARARISVVAIVTARRQ